MVYKTDMTRMSKLFFTIGLINPTSKSNDME